MTPEPGKPQGTYDEAALQRLLTEDAGLAEQGIEVTRRDGAVVLTGCVETEERRVQVAERVAECLPGDEVRNDIVVVPVQPPGEPEAIP
jgi:osmotically-inducible protein OsmY